MAQSGRDASIGLKSSQFVLRTNLKLFERFSHHSHQSDGASSRHRRLIRDLIEGRRAMLADRDIPVFST